MDHCIVFAFPALSGSNLKNHTDLFAYTSGRWLINEAHEHQQRFVEFNLDVLCRVAANQVSDSAKCVRVAKFERNYNIAFLLIMDDGREVIAKLPCPNAGPKVLMTESEVATMKFLGSRTSIRVPGVYTWSSDAANPVGAEYIIMEKIAGISLAEAWESMQTADRYEVIEQIVQMEKELAGLEFPAYGGLYLRGALSSSVPQYALSQELDPQGVFCIGPSCRRHWWDGDLDDDLQRIATGHMGPWTTLPEYASSSVERELIQIKHSEHSIQRDLSDFDASQSINDYKALLDSLKSALPALSAHDPVLAVAHPTLWHTDLHLNNIFVSPEHRTTITVILDLQSTHIAPRFIQARFPDFLAPPTGYKAGLFAPNLRPDFDTLPPDEQAEVRDHHSRELLSKYYETSLHRHNPPVLDAISLARPLWEPFVSAHLACFPSSSSLAKSLVPLRDCLIRLCDGWPSSSSSSPPSLGLADSCPYIITDAERELHATQKAEYDDRVMLAGFVQTQLLADEAGWVPHDRWEETNRVNGELYGMFIEATSVELSAGEARKKWPFPPASEGEEENNETS
ncbi:phosphotransferase family protein [Aspergillus heterothallicus]